METLNCQKGERVDITKANPGLSKVIVGLGWDPKAGGIKVDLDSFAFLLKTGKLVDLKDVIYFKNLTGPGVLHSGDNLTGEGEGDDEQITINFAEVPADVNEIVVGVNIYNAVSTGQKFGMVENAYIRVLDANNESSVFVKYDLTENSSTNTAMICGKLYRNEGEWKFQAIGQGKDGNIDEIAQSYR